MSLTMTMSLFFVVGKRRHKDITSVNFKMAASFKEKLPSAVEHKKLMFMFRIIILLTILMSLMGTKLKYIEVCRPNHLWQLKIIQEGYTMTWRILPSEKCHIDDNKRCSDKHLTPEPNLEHAK